MTTRKEPRKRKLMPVWSSKSIKMVNPPVKPENPVETEVTHHPNGLKFIKSPWS